MSGNDPHSLGEGTTMVERDKAICVYLDDAEEDQWIPKSVIHEDSEVWKGGQSGEVVVKQWWADKEGL